MKKNMKIIFPIAIILITISVYSLITSNPPHSKKFSSVKSNSIPVEVKKISLEDYRITLDSYGLVKPSVQTQITSQVSGKILYINENFSDGGYLKKGELLIEVEDIDYKADVKIAQASLLLAKQELLEEQAQGKQAKANWKKFNKNEEANALVLRTPQLESAKANLLSAKASLQKAEIQLKRTKIYAPYNARVVSKDVNIAEVISSSSSIGTIYSSKELEISLPIKNNDIKFLDEILQNNKKIKVELYSSISNKTYEAEVSGSQSSIDEESNQFYIIAKIKKDTNSLKISEYLKAKIKTVKIQNAIVIPNESIYLNEYVYIEKESRIYRRNIKILSQEDEKSLISSGLKEDEKLVLTTLGLISSGTKVKVLKSENN